MRRKEPLVTGEIYHVFSKSIAGYKIFCDEMDFCRMKQMFRYYQFGNPKLQFSVFIRSEQVKQMGLRDCLTAITQQGQEVVQFVAYCLMPTHLHLVLKQLKDRGVETFMGNLLNSYTRYFNVRRNRKGPLWESEFKNVRVSSGEQLLHLTRYVHLNPVTAYLTERPEDWEHSSYQEYHSGETGGERLCTYEGLLEINPSAYQKFVNDRIGCQRELAKVKHLMLD